MRYNDKGALAAIKLKDDAATLAHMAADQRTHDLDFLAKLSRCESHIRAIKRAYRELGHD